ncbi:MAG: hypothetical protein ACKKL4_00045 [Patescibacteria group bacterium]
MNRNEILDTFKVNDFDALNALFMQHDQVDIKNHTYDMDNPHAITNQIKEALLKLDLNSLEKEDKDTAYHILWLWHHHACTAAMWQIGDFARAKGLCATALSYIHEENPNKMTKLIWYLLHHKIQEARAWYKHEVSKEENEYAQMLFDAYDADAFGPK